MDDVEHSLMQSSNAWFRWCMLYVPEGFGW